ncbi:MAG TPA: hypothetical protein VMR89_01555 [Actinomycetota bacterium]|nr:hypothetical protein [Actinomycetota bacterium]
MSEYRSFLERASASAPSPDLPLERVLRRRDRKRRDQRIRAGIAGLGVAIAVGWMGIHAIRSTPPIPGDDRSEKLGIFAPVAGRILYEKIDPDRGYDPGFWAADPNGPSDTVPGPGVADDVASTLVPLELDGEPLGWSSDGTELLLMRSVGDGLFPEQYLSILHADGSETRLNEDPMGISSATISPDGTRVVFAGQYGLAGLYVIDAEGGRPVALPVPQAEDGASDPTFSPDGAQIAYLAGNGEGQVWVANADGTDAHEILADEPTVLRGVSGPVWSPAGDRLAIGVGTHERSGGSIYTFAPDGSAFTKAIVGGSSPYWSPDGSQIAYTIQCDEDPTFTCAQFDPQAGSSPAGLAIADADGSNVRAFGFAASGPWHPAASTEPTETTPVPSDSFARADGEVLRFTGVNFEASGDLVAVNPETGKERVLVEDLDNLYSARWSADGRWVAYETPAPEGAGIGVWVVGASQEPRLVATGGDRDLFADGSLLWGWSSTGAEVLTIRRSSSGSGDVQTIRRSTLSTIDPMTGEPTHLGSIPGDVTSPLAWSPDGTRIVFGVAGGALYSVDVRGGERSLLVRLPGEEVPSVDGILWSPDGAHIAVRTYLEPSETERLFVIDSDGSNLQVLADDYDPLGVAWSSDGTRLAFAEGSEQDDEVRIRVAPVDGAAPTAIGSLSFAGCTYNYKCGLTWSPDGSQIAFHKDEGGEITVFHANGAGEAGPVDELTYLSWAGGSYVCGCT